MSNLVQKTFSDSYIYNYDKNNNGKLIAKEINRKLIEYITSAERIDKNSEAFEGIKQEVKRQQSSSLMYSILMRDDVVLMLNSVEMPRAFKVFEAIDIKETGKKRKVFIDCTKLLVMKNGYYSCTNIFQFITYLSSAVTYLLYRNDPLKFLGNSNITIAATECYVKCFSFVLDYLRLYSSNSRSKIEYLIGLFFLNNLMGKELDNYSKNIAAKVAKISPQEIKSYELYYDIEDLSNIDTFITMLAEAFKLKGLTTEVFVTRWMYHFGKGTEYAIDLFTSFCSMITSAYCGAYVVHQKTIEKCCDRSMIKLTTSIMEAGTGSLDKSYWSEEARDEATSYVSKNAEVMHEAIKLRAALPDYAKINKEDFSSKDIVKTKAKNLTKHYILSRKESKISNKLASAGKMAIRCMDKNKVTDGYEIGCLEAIMTEGKKYFNDKDKRNLISVMDQQIRILTDAMKKDEIRVNKDLKNKISQELSELRRSEAKIAR